MMRVKDIKERDWEFWPADITHISDAGHKGNELFFRTSECGFTTSHAVGMEIFVEMWRARNPVLYKS